MLSMIQAYSGSSDEESAETSTQNPFVTQVSPPMPILPDLDNFFSKQGLQVCAAPTVLSPVLDVEPSVGITRTLSLKLQMRENGVSQSSVKTPLPPKKRKLQTLKEEIERKLELLEHISYPAQRQMSIADLQQDLPKVKTLAARKIYPEGTTGGYPEQNYYDYPRGYDQSNDYVNKKSIMNDYINGVRECSANYPVCLMIGTMHTCVHNQSTTEGNQHLTENSNQTKSPQEIPMFADQGYVGHTSLPNMPKPLVQERAMRPAKRDRKGRNASLDVPHSKRRRGRPRKKPV